jgi:DNA-binding Lrp family transcriptional regulator
MDDLDRQLINALQGGFPICERPYAEVGGRLGLDEDDVIARLELLLEDGVLSRFGPMYDAERLGGGLTLAAMAVPQHRFDEVAAIVGGFPEVAHNYQRSHALNMWFVAATERPERIAAVLREIEAATGLPVLDLPKIEEYFLELKLSA